MPRKKVEQENADRDIAILQQKIDDLKALIKEKRKGGDRKKKLLQYIKQHNYNRSDVMWCYNQLPYMNARKTEKRNETMVAKAHKKKEIKPELVAVGNRVRELRTAKGMTAVQLGRAVGRDPSLITAWERGFWRIKPDMVLKLEKVLGEKL